MPAWPGCSSRRRTSSARPGGRGCLGRRNPALAAEANALTDEWLNWIAEIVRAGQAAGEFRPGDAGVSARRVLTMIDGLGSQQVVRAVDADELKRIAHAYVTSELVRGSSV